MSQTNLILVWEQLFHPSLKICQLTTVMWTRISLVLHARLPDWTFCPSHEPQIWQHLHHVYVLFNLPSGQKLCPNSAAKQLPTAATLRLIQVTAPHLGFLLLKSSYQSSPTCVPTVTVCIKCKTFIQWHSRLWDCLARNSGTKFFLSCFCMFWNDISHSWQL